MYYLGSFGETTYTRLKWNLVDATLITEARRLLSQNQGELMFARLLDRNMSFRAKL